MTLPLEDSIFKEIVLVWVDFVFVIQNSSALQKQNQQLKYDIFGGNGVFSFLIKVVY